MNPDEARQDIREILAELHDQGLDMGEISCLVLDELTGYFEGLNAIRRIVSEME